MLPVAVGLVSEAELQLVMVPHGLVRAVVASLALATSVAESCVILFNPLFLSTTVSPISLMKPFRTICRKMQKTYDRPGLLVDLIRILILTTCNAWHMSEGDRAKARKKARRSSTSGFWWKISSYTPSRFRFSRVNSLLNFCQNLAF